MKKGFSKINPKINTGLSNNVDNLGLSNDMPGTIKMIKIDYNSGDGNSTFELFKTKEKANEFVSNNKDVINNISVCNIDKDSVYIDLYEWNYEDNSNLILEEKEIKSLDEVNNDFGKLDKDDLKVNQLIKRVENVKKELTISFGNSDKVGVDSLDFIISTHEEKIDPILNYNFELEDESLREDVEQGNISMEDIETIIKYLDSGIGGDKGDELVKITKASITRDTIITKNGEYELQIVLPDGNEIELTLNLSIDYENDEFEPIHFEYELDSGDIELNGIDEDDFYDFVKEYVKKNI